MTIQTLYRVQCQPCERYLAPESYPKPVIADTPASPLFLDFSSAYDEAVRRGWSAYPLICPDCAADLRKRALHGQEGRGTVRESGEDPERP